MTSAQKPRFVTANKPVVLNRRINWTLRQSATEAQRFAWEEIARGAFASSSGWSNASSPPTTPSAATAPETCASSPARRKTDRTLVNPRRVGQGKFEDQIKVSR